MTTVAAPAEQKPAASAAGLALGLLGMLGLAFLAWWVTQQVYQLRLPLGIPGKALEYPLWAALAGLAGNLLLKTLKWHDRARPGVRTELFLKIGLVLLGAGISFGTVATAAATAIIQGVVMITAVFFFAWWLGGRFGLDDRLRAVMSAALAICGVSAAIAARSEEHTSELQ